MSVIVKNLNYTYNPNTPFSRQALKDINLEIDTGEFVCIIGHTGSGKSTFIQHLNGLIKLQSGSIVVDDIDLSVKKPDYKALRAKVGMVFQYPEYQLFADTVYKDIAFGPTNMKLNEKDIDSRVIEAMNLVGLNPSIFKDKSPFELSGGEKRRAAIAGVIAMRPSVLVLDEPTAGLDPKGKHEILNLITDLKQKSCPTIIMVNHDMNEVCEYATKVAVMHNGTVMRYDTPQNIFSDTAFLKDMELELPSMAIIRDKLLSHGIEIDRDCLTTDKMYKELKALYDRRNS